MIKRMSEKMSMVAPYWKVHILSRLPRHLIDGYPRNSAASGVEFPAPNIDLREGYVNSMAKSR
jgi:hypothetical protein